MALFGSKPTPPTSPPKPSRPPTPPPVTRREGDELRDQARMLHRNAEVAAQESSRATELLSEMMRPGEGENSQLAEVTALLTEIAAAVARMESRLASVEQRLTGPRLVSPR